MKLMIQDKSGDGRQTDETWNWWYETNLMKYETDGTRRNWWNMKLMIKDETMQVKLMMKHETNDTRWNWWQNMKMIMK